MWRTAIFRIRMWWPRAAPELVGRMRHSTDMVPQDTLFDLRAHRYRCPD